MKDNTFNVDQHQDGKILSSLNESDLDNFKNLLHRIFDDKDMISAIHSTSSEASDEKIQIMLLQDVSYKIFSQLNTVNIELSSFKESDLYTFILLLLSFNNMGKANEGIYLGWKSRASQLRILSKRIIDQLSYIFGFELFNRIKANSLDYFKKPNNWLDENKVYNVTKEHNISLVSISDFLKKLKLSVSALSITLQESADNLQAQNPAEPNLKQRKTINSNAIKSKDYIGKEAVLSQLLSLAHSHCSFSKLYNEIESKRSTIELHCQFLKNQLRDAKPEYKSEIENNVLKFNFGLIECYQVLITKKPSLFFGKTKLKNALHKVLHCYIKVMIFYYKSYRLIPSKVLNDVHRLYQTALHYNLSQKSLVKVPEWHNQFKTIEEMYKYCLVFKLFDLYQFRFEEITLLFFAFENWASLLIMNQSYQDGDTFVLDLTTGDLLKSATILKNIENAIYINTSKIAKRLGLLFNIKEGTKHSKKKLADTELILSKSILAKLKKSLLKKNDINLTFKDFEQTISIELGIDCLKSSNKLSQVMCSLVDVKENDIDNIIIDLLPNEDYFNFNSAKLSERYQGRILGINGCQLKTHWDTLPPKQLQPGNFVTIYLDNSKKQAQIGCVKSLWLDENNQNFVIIKTISNESTLVTAKINRGNKRLRHRIILIPEQPVLKTPFSIIAPFSLFQPGQEIDIVGNNIEGTLLIGEPFETYHAHQQFEVSFTTKVNIL